MLGVELPWLDRVENAKQPWRLPVVLTRAEVDSLLANMQGSSVLIARLAYGTGMRIARREIVIRRARASAIA